MIRQRSIRNRKAFGGPALLVAVLLVVSTMILTLSGCGSSGSNTTTSQSGATSTTSIIKTKSYQDKTYNFAFSYPATWKLSQDISAGGSAGGQAAKSVGAFDPKGNKAGNVLLDGVAVQIYKLNVAVDEKILPELQAELEQVVADMEKQVPSAKVVEPLKATALNASRDTRRLTPLTGTAKPLRSRLLFLFNKNIEYQVSVQSGQAVWQTLQPMFDLVLKSFRTLS